MNDEIEKEVLFSEECKCKKLIFLRIHNKFRNKPNNFNRNEMVTARSAFKTSVKKFRQEQRKKKSRTPF